METVEYQIYFSRAHLERKRQLQRPAIIFSPTLDNWNDFNFRTRFTYQIIDDVRPRAAGQVHLAFAGENNSLQSAGKRVEQTLKGASTHLLPAKDFPVFYTMHLNMEAYRDLIKTSGKVLAEKILLAMNDLVAVKRAGRLPPWFNAAIASPPFRFAFTRNAETFFAFHNAATILAGVEHETLKGISNRLRLKFHLPVFQNPHVLRFSFQHENVLPKRVAVIIGKNGLGKSQTLSFLAKSLLSDHKRLVDENGQRPIVNRLLAVSSPGETRNTFPTPRKTNRIDYRRVFLTQKVAGDKHSALGDVLLQLIRSGQTIKDKDRWTLFCNAVSAVAPLEQLAVKLRKASRAGHGGEQDFVTLATIRDGGEEKQLERWGRIDKRADVFRRVEEKNLPLSSGQLTFVRFAAQACLHIENGTLVLVDEPETHLHPNYVSEFMRLLNRLLEDTGSFAILATHSAYLVRELPSSQVIILLQRSDREVEVSTPRLKTLGADIGAISSFVFGDNAFGDDSFEFLLPELVTKLRKARPNAELMLRSIQDELPAEAMMYLRRSLKQRIN